MYDDFQEINYITLYAAGLCFVVAAISLWLRKRKKDERKGLGEERTEDKMEKLMKNVRNLYILSMILGIILILASIVLFIYATSLGLLGFLVLQTGLILFVLGIAVSYRIKEY
jgi:NADH:ubiquinone oxidoreductase subunit 3 (subunit A)